MMKNLFTVHLRSVNETYLRHMRFAATNGIKLILGGLAALVHSVFPFLFVTSASTTALRFLSRLIDRMPTVDDEFKKLAEKILLKVKK